MKACKWCGKMIWSFERVTKKFCSVKCRQSSSMARYRSRHPNYSHDYYVATKESRYEARRLCNLAWRKKNPGRNSAATRASGLGISIEEVLRLWKQSCGICGRRQRKMNIDHNHFTGKIRGTLCRRCNTLVGLMENFVRSGKSMKLIMDWIRRG